MVFVLDPRIPRVWRTPDSIQFGVESPVLVLEGVSTAEERMLGALASGVTAEGLRVVAAKARAEPGEPEALLARVRPVLVSGRRPAPSAGMRVLIDGDGDGETAAVLGRLLSAGGAEVGVGPPWPRGVDDGDVAVDAVVIVASYAVEPQRHARWLRRDVPHLPIVYADGGVTVGPLVRPGRGPCLRCVDLHRTDADPAWPAMATQLYTREAVGETAVAAAAAAARAAAVLLAAGGGAEAGGEVARSAWLGSGAVPGAPDSGAEVLRSAGRGAEAGPAGALRSARLGAPAESGTGAPSAGLRPETKTGEAARSAPPGTGAEPGAAARSARLAPGAVDWVSRAWEPHPECGCLGLPP